MERDICSVCLHCTKPTAAKTKAILNFNQSVLLSLLIRRSCCCVSSFLPCCSYTYMYTCNLFILDLACVYVLCVLFVSLNRWIGFLHVYVNIVCLSSVHCTISVSTSLYIFHALNIIQKALNSSYCFISSHMVHD